MALTKVRGGAIDNPLTLGGGSASDNSIIFDGNAQDFHIGLDDSADSLTIGLGSTLGTTSHMVIDANGHINKPLQPAFLAKLSSDITNIATDGSVTIVFDSEIFDQNADYNNSNGYFTAPVTGRYAIYFNTRTDSIETNVTWWQWTIGASNRNISILTSAQQFDATTEQFGQNISMILDMDANDTVHMSWYQNGGTQSIDISNHVTYFGGYLVC